MKQSLWIHGIQPEKATLNNMRDCMREISILIGERNCQFHFFDWSSIIEPRQDDLWNRIKKYGNFIVKKFRNAICYLGTDMWWLLQGMRGGSRSDMYVNVMDKLEGEVKLYLNDAEEIYLITHSWGTWVGLQYIMNHPEKTFHFITLGCPLLYGSGAFSDWGSPLKLQNIKEWVNVWTENDPIALPFSENPNGEWGNFVKDIKVDSWTPFGMKAHSSYFDSKKAKQIIVDFINE